MQLVTCSTGRKVRKFEYEHDADERRSNLSYVVFGNFELDCIERVILELYANSDNSNAFGVTVEADNHRLGVHLSGAGQPHPVV